MGRHKKYIPAEKIPHNDFLDYREYDTYTDMTAASAGWGADEIGRISLVLAAGAYYYWNGATNVVWPSTGGAGAPTTSSYVTTANENPPLVGSSIHSGLTGSNLHIPKTHKASHQFGGVTDVIDVTGLSGLLADEQNAGWIKTKPVNMPLPADTGKVATWNNGTGTIEWSAAGAPGAHAATHQNGGGDEISVAGLSGELADNQPPKPHKDSHTHVVGMTDQFLAADILACNARVAVRKNSGATIDTRRRLNFVEGTGISFTITGSSGNEEVTIRIDATGAGLGGTWSTGICSGRSPIVTPHSLGGVPTLVLASINAAQPYPSPCWTADATNITFRHAVTAGCTITFAARL